MLMHFSVLMFFDWRVSLQPTIFPHSLPPSHTQQASSHLTKQPASRRKSLISHHHHVFWTSFFSQLRGHIESVHSKKKSTCPHCKVVVKVRCLNKKSNCVILKRLYLSVGTPAFICMARIYLVLHFRLLTYKPTSRRFTKVILNHEFFALKKDVENPIIQR